MVNSKTLHITYKKNLFVPAINVDLHVDSVSKETLTLSYECSSIVNGLLKGVIGFIEQKIPRCQVEILPNERRVLIHLDAFEELNKVLVVVEPTDITFNDDVVVLDMTLT